MSHQMQQPAHPPCQAVPLLDLQAQYAAIEDRVRVAMDRVLESQHFILGPEVEAMQQVVVDAVTAPLVH